MRRMSMAACSLPEPRVWTCLPSQDGGEMEDLREKARRKQVVQSR